MPKQSGTSGITTDTEGRLLFGAGALYRNYGRVDQEIIGATKEGASFEIEREDRVIDIDGVRSGSGVEGLVRTIGTTVTLKVVLPEISEQTWLDVTRGSKTTRGSKREINPGDDQGVSSAFFYGNVSLVVDKFDGSGTEIIVLKKALVQNNWTIETEDLAEAGLELTFQAYYENDALCTPPYSIGILQELLRDWDPNEDLSGQTLTERIYGKNGTLGSTSGADSNDPSWQNSPPALVFGSDDYVTVASDIWETT